MVMIVIKVMLMLLPIFVVIDYAFPWILWDLKDWLESKIDKELAPRRDE